MTPKDNLKERWIEALKRAEELREKYPDPVKAMGELFLGIGVSEEEWRKVVEEPYG